LSLSTEAKADEALDLFRKSEVAYREQRFQEAVELLQKVYELKRDPVLLYNLARAYEGARFDAQALQAYQQYLAELPGAPDAPAIERRIAALRLRIADRHGLEAQRDEERRRADTHLQETRAAELKAAQAVAQSRQLSPAPWIVAGAGGLVLGGALAFGVASSSKRENAVAAAASGVAQADLSAARGFATAANVSYGVGALVAVAGISWGLWNLAHRDSPPALAITLGPGNLIVGGHF
jgi:tetratricopeptide (TPR) repeat protein